MRRLSNRLLRKIFAQFELESWNRQLLIQTFYAKSQLISYNRSRNPNKTIQFLCNFKHVSPENFESIECKI